ncbi:hypothetical protein L6164_019459 [Bauhinia variegata]|uniref:Uncharacterized protein n=1 Tax=Bauhinia variegata TaxID=167791 RepID=A0ACB9MTZ7_BAUVA|nr:hypothetical protein L6164_019459 [Bauhinia variegata]
MARRSPKELAPCQKYETGCTWRSYKIFNFREGRARTRLVSNRKHLDTPTTGKGDSRRRPNVLTIDDKYPNINVSIFSCENISCVKNDQLSDWRNRATEMIVDQNFINGKSLGKDGEDSQSNQLVDALQILYSNKELFLKLLQDPNSLLVKQVHDFRDSQVKKQCQVRQKKVTRSAEKSILNQPQTSNEIQCGKPLKSLHRIQSLSSDKIVVLKPGPVKAQNFADTGCYCPSLHSHNSSNYNGQTVKSSHFLFSRLKRKLRHAIAGRKKEQQQRAIESVSHKFRCHCQGLEDDNQVIRLERAERNSLGTVHSDIEREGKSSLDLKKRDKMIKAKDFELSVDRQEVAESGGRNTNVTLMNPSELNKPNFLAEARRNLSEMLNNRIKECKQWTNTQGRALPFPESGFFPGSLGTHWENDYITEQMRYSPYNNCQVVFGSTLGLQKEGENNWFSMGQNIEDPLGANDKAPSNQLQSLGTNIGPPRENLHADYWIPGGSEQLMETGYGIHLREIRRMDVPSQPESRRENGLTQSFDMDSKAEGIKCFLDSPSDIQFSTFSSDVDSSSPSTSIQKIEDNDDVGNKMEEPGSESLLELFVNRDVTNTPSISSQSYELPVQAEAIHDKFEEHHIADILRSFVDPMDDSTPVNIPEHVREILQASSLKWDELVMRFQSSDQLLDPSTFDELKLLTNQLPCGTILFDCVKEVFMVVYQNFCRFVKPDVDAYVVKRTLFNEVIELFDMHCLQHPSPTTLEQLVEKDLARRDSWLNIRNDAEDIAIEMEEDLLQKLILEIVSEMDIRSMT